jgi:hypothetical protein
MCVQEQYVEGLFLRDAFLHLPRAHKAVIACTEQPHAEAAGEGVWPRLGAGVSVWRQGSWAESAVTGGGAWARSWPRWRCCCGLCWFRSVASKARQLREDSRKPLPFWRWPNLGTSTRSASTGLTRTPARHPNNPETASIIRPAVPVAARRLSRPRWPPFTFRTQARSFSTQAARKLQLPPPPSQPATAALQPFSQPESITPRRPRPHARSIALLHLREVLCHVQCLPAVAGPVARLPRLP